MPMDTNGAIGDYDPGTGVLTIHANSMNFTYFLWLYSITLKIPASKLRLVPVAAGGSFGSKFFMHKVPCFTAFLAMVAGCPVKYVEDRVTHITNNDHCGSDRHYDAALAFDDDGTFKAVRISCTDDYGAYLQFGTGTHGNSLSQIVGPYRIQNVEYALAAILTNKNQQGAYRGFGAEVSNWVIERLVDLAAQDLDVDRVEIRRRNLISADSFPYRTPTGNIYDSGNYQGVLEKVLAAVDYDHWVAERERARAEGRHVGIGVVASKSAASSARPSSGSGSTSRSSRRPRAPRARACRSTRPATSSSRCTRSRSGATARRPSCRRSWPRSSTSTRARSP
jgi:CO/xanthine dehydrogenase Mo-binding subunit